MQSIRTLIMSTLVITCLLGMTMPVFAADDPVATLKGRMTKVYAETNTYQARKTVSVTMLGDDKPRQSYTFTIVVDRPGRRMAIRADDLTLVAAEGMIRVKLNAQTERYLKMPVADPLASRELGSAWPTFSILMGIPDIALLLRHELAQKLDRDALTLAPARADDPRQGLRNREGDSELTLWLDPITHLVTTATIETRSKRPDGEPAGSTLDYQIEVTGRNAPLTDDLFAFDAGDAAPVDSLREMFGQPPGAEELKGKPAPPIVLNSLDGQQVDLTRTEAKVVVLDFWATWCGPCRTGLPKIQSIHERAVNQNQSVAVYAVNIRESNAVVRRFWNQMKLTMPVLMDTDGEVATAYRANAIPQTVIISEGKIEHVYVGLLPNLEDRIREDIAAILARK